MALIKKKECGCIHFSFLAPEKGLFCKPKYRANISPYFISVSILISQSFRRKDRFVNNGLNVLS